MQAIPFSISSVMKKILPVLLLHFYILAPAQESYKPSAENLAVRKTFQDDKYGLFIHWGLSSVLGNGNG